jgi:diguanylate cyclase (GGDEF)-like protein
MSPEAPVGGVPVAGPPIDYETLFRSLPIGSLVTGANDVILRVNDEFCAWSGHSRHDLVGASFLRLLPAGDRILFSSRTAPLLALSGRTPESAVTILGAGRIALAASMTAARADGLTVFVLTPRRERSFEEAQLISAVHRAERADTQRRDAVVDLERSAQRDALTSLLNRGGCLAPLNAMIQAAGAHEEIWTYQLGLDHFRIVNESLGEAAGDSALRTIANRLRARLGDDDGHTLLARVGADEFVIARRGRVQGPALAEEIVELVGSALTIDDLEIVMSASVGAAVARAGAHEPPPAETLIRNAATAMYEAKAAGRNRWKLFTAVGDDSAINEIRLLGEIRAALLHDQLRLEYQPQLDLASDQTQGFEALVRWDHPDRGVVGPLGFIDVPEKSGLINQVGRWVCRSAIEECGRLNRASDRPTTMSVNISARQLGDSRLAETVTEMLVINDVEPSLLTLEITETGLITDAVRTRENLERLHAAGIRISIDDFGTGHAGFAYLKDFPVDELKIDRSFVAGLGTSPEDTAIVVSCIELAHAMGVSVVAEGVETSAQLSRLRELGCDIVQGYLYSPPLDHAGLDRWLGSPSGEHKAGA